MLSNSQPHVSGTANRTNTSVTMQRVPSMANVYPLPLAWRRDKNVNETAKLEIPDPSVAAATPLPRTRSGKTSATKIQAIPVI
jgi:hypothetical protein